MIVVAAGGSLEVVAGSIEEVVVVVERLAIVSTSTKALDIVVAAKAGIVGKKSQEIVEMKIVVVMPLPTFFAILHLIFFIASCIIYCIFCSCSIIH